MAVIEIYDIPPIFYSRQLVSYQTINSYRNSTSLLLIIILRFAVVENKICSTMKNSQKYYEHDCLKNFILLFMPLSTFYMAIFSACRNWFLYEGNISMKTFNSRNC